MQKQNNPTEIKELPSVQEYVYNIFKLNFSQHFLYHNFRHFYETVEMAKEICSYYKLDEEEAEDVEIAAWFHDLGYYKDYEQHEKYSIQLVEKFMKERKYATDRIERVKKLIICTKLNVGPSNFLEEIIVDADLHNIGKETFFSRGKHLKHEWSHFLQREIPDLEWEKEQLSFLLNTDFHTSYCLVKYSDQRGKNIQAQKEIVAKLEGEEENRLTPKRGKETMYQSLYNTHISLSSIADSKANMMISINTVILSVIITVIGGGFTFTENSFIKHIRFVVPMCILLLGSLTSVIFAVMSASPKVTNRKINQEEFFTDKSSLLFFGNFTTLHLSEFMEGMKKLWSNKDMIYSHMTIDIFFLGKVLKKKYKLLNISYMIFLMSLVLCVISFMGIYFYTF